MEIRWGTTSGLEVKRYRGRIIVLDRFVDPLGYSKGC